MDTVRQLLAEGKAKEAEPIYATIIFNPHISAKRQPRLLQAMTKIQAGDAAAALALINAEAEEQKKKDPDEK